jgi:hypothetical protein
MEEIKGTVADHEAVPHRLPARTRRSAYCIVPRPGAARRLYHAIRILNIFVDPDGMPVPDFGVSAD